MSVKIAGLMTLKIDRVNARRSFAVGPVVGFANIYVSVTALALQPGGPPQSDCDHQRLYRDAPAAVTE